jgi:hypothetical protein
LKVRVPLPAGPYDGVGIQQCREHFNHSLRLYESLTANGIRRTDDPFGLLECDLAEEQCCDPQRREGHDDSAEGGNTGYFPRPERCGFEMGFHDSLS